jgi:hypothetical protein
MFRFIIAIGLLLGASALAAEAPPTNPPGASGPPANFWSQAGDRITFTPARISFPSQAGTTFLQRSQEFSHPGEGLDNALQFQTPDEQVFATIYIYYPGLSHSGLSALATDNALRSQENSGLRLLRSASVVAGGTDNAAVRMDYSGYRQNLASSAAFIKVGRWLVKIRVSGPEARRAEVEAAMDALLAGVRFEGDAHPRPAAPLSIRDCGTEMGERTAQMIAQPDVEVAAFALLGTFDGAGVEARDETHGGTSILPPRFRTHWCRPLHQDSRVYRADPSEHEGGPIDGRSLIFMPVNDAGTTMELVETNRHVFLLLYHEIGRTLLLGAYDGPPSDQQIAAILSGADEPGSRIRAAIVLRPGRGEEIHIMQRTTTTPPPST